MNLAALFLAVGLLPAQSISITGPAAAVPGSTVTAVVQLSGTAGLNVAAVQSAFILPAGVTLGAVQPIAAGFNTACGPALCLAWNLAGVLLPDGPAYSVQLLIAPDLAPGVVSIALGDTLGASIAGAAVPLAAGPAYVLQVGCGVNSWWILAAGSPCWRSR